MGNRFSPRDIHPALWAFLAAVIIVTGIITIPNILENLHVYQALFEAADDPVEQAESPPVYRALLRFEQGEFHAELTDVPADVNPRARTSYDRLLTGLFSPPSIAELEAGYITAIPRGACYLGSRVIRDTLYIELSEAFFQPHPLGEEGYNAAVQQITRTLIEAAAVRQYLLIGNGEIMAGPIPLR